MIVDRKVGEERTKLTRRVPHVYGEVTQFVDGHVVGVHAILLQCAPH